MKGRPMIPIAAAGGVEVFATSGGSISLHGSPYPAHVRGAAIDLHTPGRFGDDAPSPVDGHIEHIEELQTGVITRFETEQEVQTHIRTNKGLAMVLHCEPFGVVGDRVRLGHPFGRYLRTGYLSPWSGPHLHVEVRSSMAGHEGEPLELLGVAETFSTLPSPHHLGDSLELQIVDSQREFLGVTVSPESVARLGHLWGLLGEVGAHARCLVEGDIPWNCYGGIIHPQTPPVVEGDDVRFGTFDLGHVYQPMRTRSVFSFGEMDYAGIDRYSKGLLYRNLDLYEIPRRRCRVDGHEYLGLTLGVGIDSDPPLRLVPRHPEPPHFSVGDTVTLSLPQGHD